MRRAGAPASGALLAIVADHVIQRHVIFPAAAYLEMTRVARAVRLSGREPRATRLSRVYFMAPMFLDEPDGLWVSVELDEADEGAVRCVCWCSS